MIIGHGGNIYKLAARLGCAPDEIIDMSSNINPLDTMPGLVAFLKDNIQAIGRLPEADSGTSVNAFAVRYDLDPGFVLAGNGTTQFIYSIPQALNTKKVLIFGPTYADYADACKMQNVDHSYLIAEESKSFVPDINQIEDNISECDTVFICNPNNPTGALILASELELLCRSRPDIYFVIDESYMPFVKSGEKKSMMSLGLPNVIILNSMSKIFKIPGLRIGFLISSKQIIKKIAPFMMPWSVNGIAQAAVLYLMEKRDEVDHFIKKTRDFIEIERKVFIERFKNILSIKLFQGTTTFILARLSGNYKAEDICSYMSQHKILIRDCSNFNGLSDRFVRISLKTRNINMMAADRILSFLS
ncbi:MAG: aminotransferase class I/II-fold pyridoxal phosphate-dependent enzyme [Deltaproteobacteria bacterium]|nr:aminotransferase class I/II-fold pyridoxal phosphate-dependent enzyme [Deltaproteobacteria bacterium]